MTLTYAPPPATQAPSIPVTGTAIIYIRVSSGRQEEGASLTVQLEACRAYCEAQGLLIVAEFCDIQSGLDSSRPEYMVAVEMAKVQGTDKLVTWRMDRLGRDSAEYIPLLKELRRLGVDVVSVTQPTESIFMQQVIGIMAEEESRQLSTRVTASKQRRAKEGKWGGLPPFGYGTEKHPTGGSVLVPDDAAPLVTELFQRYDTGKHSLAGLRTFLQDSGYVRTRYAVWAMLTNPAYVGIIRHGSHTRSQFHPQSEVLESQGLHEPLVDRETFDRVQDRLSANKSRQRGGPAPKYLFSGLIYCASCGHRYVGRLAHGRGGRRWVVYNCNRRNSTGDCRAHSVFETRVREAVVPPIEALLRTLKQEDVRQAVRDELTHQQKFGDGHADSGQALTERLGKLEARLSKLEDAYLDQTIGKERYLVKRDEILGQTTDIKAAITAQPKVVTVNLDQLFAIADALSVDTLDDQAWREIVESVVDRVTIEGEGDGRKDRAKITVIWKPEYVPLMASGN